MGLLADAGYNLGDVRGLLISLVAFLMAKSIISRITPTDSGWGTIWASLLNAAILLVTAEAIETECIRKFLSPEEIGRWPIIITAGIGVMIHGLTVFFFQREK